MKSRENFRKKREVLFNHGTDRTACIRLTSKVIKAAWKVLLKKLRDYLSKEFQDIPPDVWIACIHTEDRERINEKVMKIQNDGENTGKSSG